MPQLQWLTVIAATRQYAGQLAIAFALLWPMLLLVTDHHGVTRLPTHEHLRPLGGTDAPHSHLIAAHHHDGEEHSHGAAVDAAPASSTRATSTLASNTTAIESEPILTPPAPRAMVRDGSLGLPSLASFVSFLTQNSSLPLLAWFALLLARHPGPTASRLQPAIRAGMAPPTPPPRGLIAA
jgi:hypothetical protein